MIASIQAVALALESIADSQNKAGPAMDRLEALEMSRVRHEAELEGLLMKAEGKLKASNNAEARARSMVKHYESFTDSFDADSAEVETPVRDRHADAGPAEAVQPVHLGVEETNKTRALRAKFS